MLGFDRGDVDDGIVEALAEQASDDSQRRGTGARRQTTHMVHVLVVAAQLFIHGRGAHRRVRDGALSPQDKQQMPKCRAVVAAVMAYGSGARATRQVIVKKYRDRDFVDPGQRHTPGACPAREMRDLGKVAGDSVCGVPALGQVTLERGGVGADGAAREPINFGQVRSLSGIHGGLQKWNHQCAPNRKLCPVLQLTITPHAASMLRRRPRHRTTCA